MSIVEAIQQLVGLVQNQADALVCTLKVFLNVLKKELRLAEYHRLVVTAMKTLQKIVKINVALFLANSIR